MYLYDKKRIDNANNFFKKISSDKQRIYASSFTTRTEMTKTLDSIRLYLDTNNVVAPIKEKLLLAFEELLLNIYDYGNKIQGKSKYIVDTRLIALDHSIKIRIRDNMSPHDTKEYLNNMLNKPNDLNLVYIAAKLIIEIASDIKYTYALNFNNLLLTIEY